MNFKFLKRRQAGPKSALIEWRDSILFAVIVATLFRWSMVEAYVIPTPSMENTMLVGDYLFVSKIHYGPRTPRTPLQIPLTHQTIWGTDIPSYLDWLELPSYRFPGISQVEREDVVVFNVPAKSENDGIDHPIDLKKFYVKRCVALPGDVLTIQDGRLTVNGNELRHYPGMKFSYLVRARDKINPRHLKRAGLDSNDIYFLGYTIDNAVIYRMLLTNDQLSVVQGFSFVREVSRDHTRADAPEENIFPSSRFGWNGDNYGSLTIPAKGMKISINDSTLALYGETIRQYEHHDAVKIESGRLAIDGEEVREYTFRQDYYFMMGDNRNNSQDSRYWGFVPADHIVGKALFIWFSYDSEADLLERIRWDRIFTQIR